MIFFLSSSFADMQVERDLMMFEVMPAFRKIAAAHGDYATHLDLRWGIPTWGMSEEEISKRILETCTRAIDDSRPYIIIFLSKRYGSTNMTPNGQSVTEYEIDHALKEKTRCVICLRDINKKDVPKKFWDTYFNQEEKINALSKDLKQKYPSNVIEYTATWQGDKFGNFLTKQGQSLKEALLEKMTTLCNEDWKISDTLDWQTQELITHNKFYRQKSKEFFGRDEKLSALMKCLTHSNVLFLKGDAGIGKTTMCSKLAQELNKRAFVCCIFAGTTTRTSTALDLLKLMVFFLEELLNQPHKNFEEYDRWKIYFIEGLIPQFAKSEQQIYFVLDGVNQLKDDSHRNEFDFLPTNSATNVHFLSSYTTDDGWSLPLNFYNPMNEMKSDGLFDADESEFESKVQAICADIDEDFSKEILQIFCGIAPEVADNLTRDEIDNIYRQSFRILKENFSDDNDDENSKIKILKLEAPETSEISVIMGGILSKSGRELFYQTATAVKSKKKSTNLLYLRLIATLLNLISSRELEELKKPQDIVALTILLIKELPDDTVEAANFILNKTAKLICTKPAETIQAIRTIAASRNGLRLSDLTGIGGENFLQVDFSLIQNYLSDFFVTLSDGRITFSHSLIKSGLNIDPDLSFANLVSNHIKNLPTSDPLRAEEIFYYSQISEDYELAARLCGEAWGKKNPGLKQTLTSSIAREILSDGGNFFADLLNNHLKDLSSNAISGIWLFFVGDKSIQNEFHGSAAKHCTFLKILNGISDNWKYFQQEFESYGLGYTEFNYYLVVVLQAQYRLLVGETNIASTLCREVTDWGNKNLELKDDCNTAAEFRKLMYDAYRILRIITRSDRTNDNNLLNLLERETYWLGLAFERVPTKRIEFTLVELRCLTAQEKYVMKLISADKFLKELSFAYNIIQKYLGETPEDYQLLSMMVNICLTTTDLNMYIRHTDETNCWAEKTEIYAGKLKLLLLDPNNPDILRNVGRTWYILHWVAMIKEDYQTADEYAKKSMELYMRLYATNPTWRHLRLVIETFTEFGDNYEKIGALSNAVFCYETAMNYVRMGENYFQEYHQQISELKETLQRNLEKINDFRF